MIENDLPGKADTIKRFECSPLGIELRKQNDIVKKQYQGLEKLMNLINRMIFKKLTNKNEKLTDRDEILLFKYDSRFNFNKYKNDNFFSSESNYLKEFHDKLIHFKEIKSMDKI